ncbi:MAG: hypothetical protein ACPGID_03340 [Rubricella sp.]
MLIHEWTVFDSDALPFAGSDTLWFDDLPGGAVAVRAVGRGDATLLTVTLGSNWSVSGASVVDDAALSGVTGHAVSPDGGGILTGWSAIDLAPDGTVGRTLAGRIVEAAYTQGGAWVVTSGGSGIALASASDPAAPLARIGDDPLLGLGDVSALATAEIAGRSFIFAASAFDGGITTVEILPGAALAPRGVIRPDGDWPAWLPSDLGVLDVAGQFWLVATASGSGTVSQFAIGSDGALRHIETLADLGSLALGGAHTLAVAEGDGYGIVAVAGGEAGLSIFAVDADGLTPLETLWSNAAAPLRSIGDIAVRKTEGEILLAVTDSETGALSLFGIEPPMRALRVDGTPTPPAGTELADRITGLGDGADAIGGGGTDLLTAAPLERDPVVAIGANAVLPFDPSTQRIDLSALGITGFDALSIISHPAGTSIAYAGGRLVVEGVDTGFVWGEDHFIFA